MIGDAGVGKTHLIRKFQKEEGEIAPTLMVDMVRFQQHLDEPDINVNVVIWDTAGQEKYTKLNNNYYKKADAFMLVYDVTVKESFENLERWLKVVQEHKGDDVIMLLVGNKIDIQEKRQISPEQGKEFASNNQMFFMETSAITNENDCVAQAFMKIIEETAQQVMVRQTKEFENLIEKERETMLSIETNDSGCKC